MMKQWGIWIRDLQTRDDNWLAGTGGKPIWFETFAQAEDIVSTLRDPPNERWEYEVMEDPIHRCPECRQSVEYKGNQKWICTTRGCSQAVFYAHGPDLREARLDEDGVPQFPCGCFAPSHEKFCPVHRSIKPKSKAPGARFDRRELLKANKYDLVDLLMCEREWMLAFKEDARVLLNEKDAQSRSNETPTTIGGSIEPEDREASAALFDRLRGDELINGATIARLAPEVESALCLHRIRTSLAIRPDKCTCGSGMHPRRCGKHPDAFAEQAARLNAATAITDLLTDLHAQGVLELTDRSIGINELITEACIAVDPDPKPPTE